MEQNKDKGTYEDFLELAGYNDPSQVEIVPTCRVRNVVKMKVFVIELLRQAAGQNPDKFRIFKLIDTAFKAELGLKGENAIWWELAPDDKKPPKKVFVNTTDEAELFPELRQFCEEEIDEKPSCSYSAREKGKAKRYLSLYMEKWRKGQETPSKPQQKDEKQPELIPTVNDTDEEKRVFRNALQKQYMTLKDGCYKWTLTNSLLAYMCGRLYCGDRIKDEDSNSSYKYEYVRGRTQMPAQKVKALFGGVDVAGNRYAIKSPPRNKWKVDKLFEGDGASR